MSRRMNAFNANKITDVDGEVEQMFPIKSLRELEDLEARCGNTAYKENIVRLNYCYIKQINILIYYV